MKAVFPFNLPSLPGIRVIIVLFILLISFQQLSAQDRIIKKTGEIIYCDIVHVDSTCITYALKKEKKKISNKLNRNEISEYNYVFKYTASKKYFVDTLESLELMLVYHRNNSIPVKMFQQGRCIRFAQLGRMIKKDAEAYAIYQSGKRKNMVLTVFFRSDVALLGLVAVLVINGDINKESIIMIAGSSAFIGLGIGLAPKVKDLMFEAAKKYDRDFMDTSTP